MLDVFRHDLAILTINWLFGLWFGHVGQKLAVLVMNRSFGPWICHLGMNWKVWPFICSVRHALSDFSMGRILGKHFTEAQVHTVHRTSAAGMSPIDSMDECFRKMLSQNSPHADVAFSISCHLLDIKIC